MKVRFCRYADGFDEVLVEFDHPGPLPTRDEWVVLADGSEFWVLDVRWVVEDLSTLAFRSLPSLVYEVGLSQEDRP